MKKADQYGLRAENQKQQREAREANRRSGWVQTPDGVGRVLHKARRKNTNGGPGSQEYRVELVDGRIRHYSPAKLTPTEPPPGPPSSPPPPPADGEAGQD